MVATSEPRISFVDLILGLLAAASDEVRTYTNGQRSAFFQTNFFEGLIRLQEQPEYADELVSLVDDASFGDVLFQLGTWRLIEYDCRGRAIAVRKLTAQHLLEKLGEEYGPAAVGKVRRIAREILGFSNH